MAIPGWWNVGLVPQETDSISSKWDGSCPSLGTPSNHRPPPRFFIRGPGCCPSSDFLLPLPLFLFVVLFGRSSCRYFLLRYVLGFLAIHTTHPHLFLSQSASSQACRTHSLSTARQSCQRRPLSFHRLPPTQQTYSHLSIRLALSGLSLSIDLLFVQSPQSPVLTRSHHDERHPSRSFPRFCRLGTDRRQRLQHGLLPRRSPRRAARCDFLRRSLRRVRPRPRVRRQQQQPVRFLGSSGLHRRGVLEQRVWLQRVPRCKQRDGVGVVLVDGASFVSDSSPGAVHHHGVLVVHGRRILQHGLWVRVYQGC